MTPLVLSTIALIVLSVGWLSHRLLRHGASRSFVMSMMANIHLLFAILVLQVIGDGWVQTLTFLIMISGFVYFLVLEFRVRNLPDIPKA